jgi:phosphopantothenoylcysteine decarboxylase/phosphopantothenoylcysteine decarboxylase/phosphopantothenate--cysteine ligase
VKTILLGVTGSIAAYKAAELTSRFIKKGHDVRVIMTKSAREFITPLTFQTLSGHPVYTEMFAGIEKEEVEHIALAKRADLALIAPATANIAAKLANGIADDMLTSVILALRNKPVLICPAMNTAMWENPITKMNFGKLISCGCRIAEPRESRLACGDVGRGALADIDVIISLAEELLNAYN